MRDSPAQRGMTIVETMVVIGLIGILFAFAFPALMRTRAAAGRTKSLVNARTIAALIHEHARAHEDRYPMVEVGDQLPAPGSSGAWISFAVDPPARWQTRHFWHVVIDDVAPVAEHWPVYLSPGADEDRSSPSYSFSNSFVAAARLWTADYDGSEDVLRPVRLFEVAHPSQKAMIWDQQMAYLHRSVEAAEGLEHEPMPIAFADEHAEARRLIDGADAVPNPLNEDWWRASKLHNTPRGVLGRDY